MKNKKSGNLFRRYMLNMLAVIFLVLAIMSLLFLSLEITHWRNEQTQSLRANVNIVSENVVELMNSADDDSAKAALPLFILSNTVDTLSRTGGCDIFITDLSGSVILCREMYLQSERGYCQKHSAYKIPQSVLEKAAKSDYSEITDLSGLFSTRQLVVAAPIVSNGSTLGIVFALKEVDTTLIEYAGDVAKIMALSAVVSIIVAFFIVYGFVYRITKPLRSMSKATKLYAQGDFSYMVEVGGNDEMTDLANAFNSMAKSLSVLESSRRSFVANVSHELKTPMTTIGGFIDGILDGTIPPESERHYLQIVSDEIKRLSRLVTGMLNMSKLEAGEMSLKTKRFDISQTIFKTLITFEKVINEKSVDIRGLDKMQSVYVNADEDMMLQVIYNLIDNAVKFTPEGGYIDFSAVTDGDFVYVSIKNSGDGISAEELGKIFERFYKTDKSRSYDVKGAGLGLYIVKSIINLHGGEIKASSIPGDYTEFSFKIPAN